MNPILQPVPPANAGRKIPVPLSVFEITDATIPVRILDGFMIQDKLREDQDLGECSFKTLRPARWSALNEF